MPDCSSHLKDTLDCLIGPTQKVTSRVILYVSTVSSVDVFARTKSETVVELKEKPGRNCKLMLK
jgi:hypothetical protein